MRTVTLCPGGPLLSGAVYGCLLNVQDELDRLGAAINEPPYNGAPTGPVMYIKTPNTQIPAGSKVVVPADVDALQVGATLGVVIGDTLTRADVGQASKAITGYTLVNDLTVPHESLFRQPLKQKCRDGFCPIGPRLVYADDLPDPDGVTIRALINGECRHEWRLDRLVRPIAKLLADISDFTSLYPGDLILVGVSPDGPLARPGDSVAVEANGLGRLENPLAREGEEVQ